MSNFLQLFTDYSCEKLASYLLKNLCIKKVFNIFGDNIKFYETYIEINKNELFM